MLVALCRTLTCSGRSSGGTQMRVERLPKKTAFQMKDELTLPMTFVSTAGGGEKRKTKKEPR